MEEEHYSAANDKGEVVVAVEQQAEEEESGWTSYFEDFCCDDDDNKIKEREMSCFEDSMVSDASSLPTPTSAAAAAAAAWNKSSSLPHYGNYSLPKKLSFKKRRGQYGNYHDDSLEDTASSPVNSPKVYDTRKLEMNSKRTSSNHNNIDPFSNITTLGDINSNKGSVEQVEQMNREKDDDEMMTMMMDFNSKNEECTELKKKGLCLVPLSMLLHYIG